MVRKGGDDAAHVCLFCLSRLQFVEHADWLQCPHCKDVSHAKCLFKYIADTESPMCVNCRASLPPENELDDKWQVDLIY